MKAKTFTYWTTTSLVGLAVLAGGAAQITHQQQNVEGIVHLGYPAYLATILGFWKICGGLTILVPGFPRVKEWAYAGIFFVLTGAAASHAICHDPAWHVAATLTLAGLAVASWALRPGSRRMDAGADSPAVTWTRPHPSMS